MNSSSRTQDALQTKSQIENISAGLVNPPPVARSTQLSKTPANAVASDYVNTIPLSEQGQYPGDEAVEKRIEALVRWNAAAIVIRANQKTEGIGGHVSSYASSASLYETAFNWFFKGKNQGNAGDAIFFQGHISPGIYARSFLEGRFTAEHLDNFRCETYNEGLSSYPHPRLMPTYWEHPTVSMGLGPINSLFHAKYLRYLEQRGIDDTSGSRVWAFLGDGECDEPETLGALQTAANNSLDNLTWVVNCNLQRLDGPVRGNGKIIQDLEGVFRGAGWNVLKVVWGSQWDQLLSNDIHGVLLDRMNSTVDGEFQRYVTEGGAYFRKQFFGTDPRLSQLVEHLTDTDLENLARGGHDNKKVFAAYKAAVEHKGQPTVILAKTLKGFTLGQEFEAHNRTHQAKQLNADQLINLRDRLNLEDLISDETLLDGCPPYVKLDPTSREYRYLIHRREQLNGYLPQRSEKVRIPLPRPSDRPYDFLRNGSSGQPVTTTEAYAELVASLMREPGFGQRIVPIVPDEASVFGMNKMFQEFGIYSSIGQKYQAIDHDQPTAYSEKLNGQILQEGINEAGAMASWTASATSYSHQGITTVPFYTFYSMFGFQRTGDQIWAAANAKAKGFLIGATAGRTTLQGEGLQHQDGQSLSMAANVPSCQAYDPAFAYEIAAIVRDGINRMYGNNEDIFYYITTYNEAYIQPPQRHISDSAIVDGLYLFATPPNPSPAQASILFSGPAHTAARQARIELSQKWGVEADLWSATSYKRLAEQAQDAERWNRLHPTETPIQATVNELLGVSDRPVIAVTDYTKSVPNQISPHLKRPFTALGTDGYGRSDTRGTLRQFFETDAPSIVIAVLTQLREQGQVSPEIVVQALRHYNVDSEAAPPRVC